MLKQTNHQAPPSTLVIQATLAGSLAAKLHLLSFCGTCVVLILAFTIIAERALPDLRDNTNVGKNYRDRHHADQVLP